MSYGDAFVRAAGRVRVQAVLIASTATVLLSLVGWAFAPKYLFFFDSVNFALAVDDFNPALHQPQPPGYPLFVLTLRVLTVFMPRVEEAFVLSGVLAGAGATVLIFCLGRSMLPAPSLAGASVAALLFAFHPILWFSLLTNQVRSYLALVGSAVALCLWRAWHDREDHRWLPLAGLVLGLGSGFRPALLLHLAPLFVLTLWRKRSNRLEGASALLLACAGTAMWLIPTIAASGGLTTFIALLRGYSVEQFGGTSFLYGASGKGALGMALLAIAWNVAGALRWAWALPLAIRRRHALNLDAVLFLLTWFVPAFLFHALVHVADPDHILVTVPPANLLGGWVLSTAFERRRGRTIATAAALGIGVLLFFKPVTVPAKMMSYRVVRFVDDVTSTTLERLEKLKAQGRPLVIDWRGAPVSWRTLSYYFPDVPILVTEGSARFLVRGNRRSPVDELGSPALAGTVIVVLEGAAVKTALPHPSGM